MDFPPRYPAQSSSESSTIVYTNSPKCDPNFKAHWYNNMYSTQNLDSSNKQKLLTGSLHGNTKNYNFNNRMYSTKQSLSVDDMANQPKKTGLQGLFRSMSNLVTEHLSRGTSSFFRNWSGMNMPLSVTVVSTDFYKSWQRGKDHQLVEPTSAFYGRTWSKDSPHSSDEMSVPNVLFDNEILSDSIKLSCSDPTDSDERWKQYKCMYVNCNETQGKEEVQKKVIGGVEKEKELDTDVKIINSVNKKDCNNEKLESNFNVISDTKELDRSTNFGSMLKVDDEPIMLEKPELTQQEIMQQEHLQQTSQPQKMTQPTIVGTMLSQAYNKVVNGVSDLLQIGTANISDAEASSLFQKRACSPKPRDKRMHNVSSGRGRGRAKSQLRRSGVSQTRHRKERSRYDHREDIKSDIDNWEELEYCQSTDDDGGVDVCDFAGGPGKFHNEDEEFKQRTSTNVFTLADFKPRKRKPKKAKNHGWANVSVAFAMPRLDEDGDIDPDCVNQLGFRSRLMSDSSVDSEDSYCIVFEDDGCSEESEFESDLESSTASEKETDDSEDEDAEDDTDDDVQSTRHAKVRFNLTPTVHKMIHWSFAYKAARPGPWEQMGRDRDRFRSRINCIGRVVEPVLAKQHRMRIYDERFAE